MIQVLRSRSKTRDVSDDCEPLLIEKGESLSMEQCGKKLVGPDYDHSSGNGYYLADANEQVPLTANIIARSEVSSYSIYRSIQIINTCTLTYNKHRMVTNTKLVVVCTRSLLTRIGRFYHLTEGGANMRDGVSMFRVDLTIKYFMKATYFYIVSLHVT